MITADKLKALTVLTTRELALLLDKSGYSMCVFKTARFLGITSDGHFCYEVSYYDDAGTGQDEVGKVYLTYDHVTGNVTADF